MKILLAAASFASKMSGLQRHALNVARCLLLEPEVSALHLVIAPWQHHFVQAAGLDSDSRVVTHIAKMDKSSVSRNLWYYRDLPELAARLEVDLVHFSYPMPVNAAAFSCPTLLTLHDLYPYEIPMNFGFPKFIFNRLILNQCLRNADAIACSAAVRAASGERARTCDACRASWAARCRYWVASVSMCIVDEPPCQSAVAMSFKATPGRRGG